ncbi:hypothetical protein V6N11_067678 [Hibiscus sabdariffa]|uniref:Uncharacterized protein n=1 Tax=Hibiscus sabdariffa TaxID=183260 RepID=A0ABR2SRH5_9ROSI
MDLEFPFPKLSFPVSHLLLSQFSNSGGFLFEYGLGVVGSPSRGILLVSISVFGLDLDERWQRFGWGGVFTNLCLVSERLSMARAYDSPKEGALDGVSIPIVSLGQSSGKSTSSSLQFRKSTTWNTIMNLFGNGLGFLTLHGSSLSMSRFFLVLARTRVGLVLWLYDWKAKVSLQEGETHDGGSMLTLSYGYCTASLSFTHGQLGSNSSDTLVRSLQGYFPLSLNPRFSGISFGSSAPNPTMLDLLLLSLKFAVRTVEDILDPVSTVAIKGLYTDFLLGLLNLPAGKSTARGAEVTFHSLGGFGCWFMLVFLWDMVPLVCLSSIVMSVVTLVYE